MFFARLVRRCALPTMLALGLGLLTGCTDGLLTETQSTSQDEPDDPAATSDSKLRHGHLLAGPNGPSKRILERYEDLVVTTEFMLGVSSTTLDMNRVS